MSQSNIRETVLKLAKLSKLNISEDDFEKVAQDMEKTLDFVDQINEAKVKDEDFEDINDLSNVLREDEIKPSSPQEEILKNVNGGKDGYFYIKKSVS